MLEKVEKVAFPSSPRSLMKTQKDKDLRHKSDLVPGLPALKRSCYWHLLGFLL